MNNIIYGIDLDKEITPLMARDAIVECFWQAHCADSGIDISEEKTNRSYCVEIVKKAFVNVGGDFEKPTKESILKVLDDLKDFSKNFRDPSIIQYHSREIMKLVNKMV